ncbi:hypothetical protein FHS44_002636 [Streptosporangium saharense]|uniref:Uncharacterized protein n=1 Tax=Streptosporangium saharense TaxID=1706840 RepID=A0A7W7QM01_9ACTN|nr:hypothetical protein [Streptosporangium saharense]
MDESVRTVPSPTRFVVELEVIVHGQEAMTAGFAV